MKHIIEYVFTYLYLAALFSVFFFYLGMVYAEAYLQMSYTGESQLFWWVLLALTIIVPGILVYQIQIRRHPR